MCAGYILTTTLTCPACNQYFHREIDLRCHAEADYFGKDANEELEFKTIYPWLYYMDLQYSKKKKYFNNYLLKLI